MSLDLSNSGQEGDFLAVVDVRSIADEGVRAQLITDLEALARDPQAKTPARTLQGVLDAVGVKVQVERLSSGQRGELLDHVRQRAPQWLAAMRDQANVAAKTARATMAALASQPEAERIFLGKAIVLEQEADRAHRAFITARAALSWRQRRGTVGEALMEQSRVEARAARHAALTKAARDARDAPATRRWRKDADGGTYELNADGTLAGTDGLLPAPAFLEKAAGAASGAAASGLLAQAAEYRQLAAMPGMPASDVATMLAAADALERQARGEG